MLNCSLKVLCSFPLSPPKIIFVKPFSIPFLITIHVYSVADAFCFKILIRHYLHIRMGGKSCFLFEAGFLKLCERMDNNSCCRESTLKFSRLYVLYYIVYLLLGIGYRLSQFFNTRNRFGFCKYALLPAVFENLGDGIVVRR
jgi:hypothetical protein